MTLSGPPLLVFFWFEHVGGPSVNRKNERENKKEKDAAPFETMQGRSKSATCADRIA